MSSAFQEVPREGNFYQVFHIFAFMKNNPKLTIYFDPRSPNIYIPRQFQVFKQNNLYNHIELQWKNNKNIFQDQEISQLVLLNL